MADFVVSSRNDFKGKRILDLGAGVGLTSIVAALYADHVICTGKQLWCTKRISLKCLILFNLN
jgi:predicted nicotinamide N-methyase